MGSASRSTIENISAGNGRIVVRLHGSKAVFSELSYTYPLKLLSPRLVQDRVAIVYALTYGGGLVGGDNITLSIDVGDGSLLVLLSQGSTKVFKVRPGNRRASTRPALSGDHSVTAQNMHVSIARKGALFLLPDPVTCFRSALYNQKQIFHLSGDASVVLLDWVTSGRKSLGEEWVFSKYYSLNEVWIDGERIARDAVLLEEQVADTQPLPSRSLSDTLSPYSCYATVILSGPMVADIIRDLTISYEAISVFKQSAPSDLIWSLSPITKGLGSVVRVAGKETEYVKNWLGDALRKLEDVIGIDIYRKAFS